MSAEDSRGGGGRPEDAAPVGARLAALLETLRLTPTPPSPCPYLPGREARLVVVRPQPLTPALYHAFLDLNFRRLSDLVYRPQCEGCGECRELRVAVDAFQPSRAQRRCAARNREVIAECGTPQATSEKHAVYERYLATRHDGQMSGGWQEFVELHAGPPFTREVVFRSEGRLLGAGIFDATPRALSAVYFYFDPELARRSPGVLNVLWLLSECRRLALPWLYLGYHVAACAKMAYKQVFSPHQTLGPDLRWR